MKALPALALAAASLVLNNGTAGAPQPVIQMPQHQTNPAPESAPDAGADLPPSLTTGSAAQALRAGRGSCLGDGTGYVRARIRGALDLDLNWKDSQLECRGDARPDGTGLRVSFAGPGPGGKLMRLVFGVRSAREGSPGKELPTNLTLLLDGGRIFATSGDDKCTTDQLSQKPLPGKPGLREWRIEARGFCIEPANALAGNGRIVVSRFDFAGRIEFSGVVAK